MVQNGSHGDDVHGLQQMFKLSQDGIAGTDTTNAIITFLQQQRLVAKASVARIHGMTVLQQVKPDYQQLDIIMKQGVLLRLATDDNQETEEQQRRVLKVMKISNQSDSSLWPLHGLTVNETATSLFPSCMRNSSSNWRVRNVNASIVRQTISTRCFDFTVNLSLP